MKQLRANTIVTLAEKLRLRPITELNRTEQLRVLELRNQENVRRNMYSDHIIGEDEHLRWIARLKADDRAEFFAGFLGGKIVGGANLTAISRANKRADCGFCIDENKQGQGLGSALLDYAFLENDFEKLNCEVLDFNTVAVSLHKKFGFVEEGFRRDHILRDGENARRVLSRNHQAGMA
jgi:UDP-4-amino-4,6-dideoxy-N-acetyl-beta-L-altrosamine N-acetyltransferase